MNNYEKILWVERVAEWQIKRLRMQIEEIEADRDAYIKMLQNDPGTSDQED